MNHAVIGESCSGKMPPLCHPEAHDLCGPKDLCNRGAYEAEVHRSFAAEDAAQDDNFRRGS